MSITTERGLRNFIDNIEPLMKQLHEATPINRPKPVKLMPEQARTIVNFYTEVRLFMAEYHPGIDRNVAESYSGKSGG